MISSYDLKVGTDLVLYDLYFEERRITYEITTGPGSFIEINIPITRGLIKRIGYKSVKWVLLQMKIGGIDTKCLAWYEELNVDVLLDYRLLASKHFPIRWFNMFVHTIKQDKHRREGIPLSYVNIDTQVSCSTYLTQEYNLAQMHNVDERSFFNPDFLDISE